MDGWQFMDQFEKFVAPDNCMIFVLTSSAYQQDIDKLLENPLVEDVVTKPITDYILKEIKKTVVAKFEN